MSVQNNKSCSIEGFKVNYLKCHLKKYAHTEPLETKYFLNNVEYSKKEMEEILVRLHNLSPSLFDNFRK